MSAHRASSPTRQRWGRWPAWLALSVVALALWGGLAPPSTAQDHSTSDWETSEDSLQCQPTCRAGFECVQGECRAMCSPACGEGFLCTAGGTCVREKPRAVAKPPAEAPLITDLDGCTPACRPSFVCIQAQCVSACNPLCSEGEVCTAEGTCVPGPTSAPPEPEHVDPSRKSVVNLHADVLGLLQFGLTPTVEFGKRWAGHVRLRLPNTGLLSYVLLPRDDMELHWGLGGAVGVRYYGSREGNMRGAFGGLSLEYLFLRTRDETRRKAVYGTHALIPELDAGYRFSFDGFLLGMGGRIGLAIPAASYDDPIGKGGCVGAGACADERDLLFVGGLFLDLGWFL